MPGSGREVKPSEDIRGRFSGEANKFERSDTDSRLRKIQGEGLKLLKRTEAELLDERETLPWQEGGVRRTADFSLTRS
jgi:hypothetical protein